MDIRAKLAALKNAGKSPADSKTPARSGANAFGRMMEGGAPFTFPESTPWPTDENMGDVSSKIKELKDKAGVVPTTSSSITQGDGSSAGDLVFGGKKRDQQPADINIGQPGDLVFGGKKDESTTTRKAADQVLREAEELAGAKDAGFLKGIASGFDAVDTFTAGLAKSSRKNAQVLTTRNIEKKIKAGLPLSNDEQLFVDAVGLRQKADELLEQSGGKSIGYQAGNVTGAMPEFIAQIAMTKGVGDGVGTTMKAIPFIKEGLKAGALKKGTTLAGIELGKAAVVSPLQPMFASAFADQELGQYYVGTDANGEVVAERNNPQSVTASLAKAFAYTLTENWSEGMGEIFGQAGTKLAQGVAKSKLGVRLAGSQLGSLVAKTEETVAKVTGSMGTKADDFGLGGVRAFTKDVLKWNGTLNEIAEEEFNNVVQPLLMGEPEQLKQLIDPEQQLVTALSCAVAGVGFKAIEVPGYVRSGIAIKQNKEAYQESLANLRPEIASQVVAAFGEQDIAARGKALAALPWMDMQPAEREQVVNAAYHKTKYDFLRGAKSASEAEEKLSSIKQKVDYFSFKGVHNFDPSLYAAILYNGVPVTIVDGDIQSYTNGDNSTLYLAGKNRKPVVVTADGRRLMVDPIQLNGISRISSAEYTNASIDQFLQQQAVEDDTNDINDAEEDMQVASLQPMLTAAPISEQQATPEIQTTPQQPIAETNTNNDYIPKVSDTVVTPNGYVGKVVQSSMDGAIVSYLDENGDEQIEVVGPNDPIQPYQPAEDELQPAPANLVNDGNGNISQYQPVEDEKEPTISKMETAEVLPVETSNSNTEQQATTETKAAPTVQEEAVVAPSYPELAKEISNTVNDEPSVEEPHYVSKNRKYLYTFKNGSLLIMDRNGIEIPPVINGRINPQHTRLSKEYKNVFDYSKGEEGTADGATSEAEAILMLINSSKNPLELANLYLSETARGNDLVRDMEVSVVGVILDVAQSHKVSKDGFEEWSDANNISGTIAKTFFSKDGVNPSDIAALANAQLKGEWDANNEMVTANDVVQAIIDYPRGVQDLERVIKDGTAAKAAHDAFIGITGFAITPAVINRIAAYQTEETPSILSEEELQQQMADDEWQARIDAAKQAGIDMAAEQYGLFLEPTLQQNENSNVEQESNISNDELPSTQRTESENTINTAEGNNSGEQEGDQGTIQQPEEPNQQEVGLSPTKQSEYDKRKLEIEREIADLTDKLSAARKSKDKAINEAQMRNGLFGDTATDPRQTTIDGGGTLDVLSGVNTISKKHSETISQLSKAIQAKKKEMEGLLGAISSQQEIQPQDELIVQNHTTSSVEPTVEEDDKNLAVQNHTTKIDDFGEVLHGARKDMMQKVNDVVSNITDDRIINYPLSKVIPTVDLKAMIDAGIMTPKEAGLLQYMRSEIGVKPHKRYKISSYLDNVRSYVDMLNEITSRESIPTPDLASAIVDSKKKGTSSWAVEQLSMNITYHSLLVGVPGASMFEVKKFDNHKGYSIIKGNIIVKSDIPTIEDAAAAVKTFLEKKAENRKDVSLKFYEDTSTKTIFIGWKGSTGVVRIQEGFDNIKDAKAYYNEHEAELVEKLDNIKNIPNERRATNTERIGKDYRNGNNVTPNMFTEAFGFRGVQFGNWVEGDRRQQSLNYAYDALMDLSNVLGIPPKAVSLGGKLGLAFGSRGKGGKKAPSAHYEPDTMVINLTKENGAGSLAHEWWHALDNHFGKINKSTGGFATADPYKKNGSELRQAMSDVFRELRTAIHTTKLKSRSEKLDKTRSKQYWSTNVEMSARAFEGYVVDRLSEQDTSNDYLANLKTQSEWMQNRQKQDDYPYPTADEAKKINAAFDKLISTIEHRTEEDGSVVMFSRTKSLPESKISEASESVKEAKDTAAKLYDSIAETSDSISSQYSVMQHLDGTAQNAIIEAVEPLVKQWSEAENKKQDAVGVLVQTRRIYTELPLLAENLSRVKAPEGGWTTDSAQAFLDDMKSKYPTAGEAIAVENANVAADTILELGYSQYMADKVRNEDWDGVTLPDGRVIIRVDNPNLHISSIWAHEQGHSLISRMFNSKDRMALGEAVCNAIGVHDILDYIGNEYANEPIWLIGEEYLTHRVGSIAKGDSIEATPADVEILHNAKNGITPDSVEQIISTLVSQILKNNGKDKSGWNGDDIEIRPRDNASFQQNDNSGSIRAVHEANSGRNDTGSILESNQQGEKHQERVAAAEDLTDTNPSDAQKIAGNYRKGKARVLGMEISIENPKGSTRSGVDPNGKAWSITMPQPYGYILGTVGKDKDHVDVYIGRNLTKDTPVFIVNQVNPSTGAFDEHKVMIGYPTYGSAKRAYMSAYEQGWQGFGSMGEMSLDEFKEWAYSNKTKKEATPTEPTPELADSPEFSSTWHDDDFLGMPTDFGSAIAFARRRGGDVRIPDKNMSLLDGTFDKVREQIQDATLRVRKLQDRIEQSGGKVPFAANAWEALNRYTSAAKAKMDYFENGELNNLITVAGDLCKKVDATWEQLNDYLMCKHGIDRQEVGDVNVFSTVAGSEWTLSNAQQTVKDFESKTTTEDIDKLWLAVREATTASLKALKDGGVISENDMNGYLSREGWQNYVPLRDFDVTDEMKADDVFEYSESRNPQRGTFVKATQTAKGRTSKPNSPIPQIAAMFALSVALAEKNRAKQALLNLVRLNPKREEYTVTRSWYVLDKGTNTTLEVYEKPKPSLIDLQNACIDFFVAPDIQSKNAMVQQLQDMQQAAIDDGADPNLVGLVMRQGMQEGAYTITTKPHKSSILGETKEQDSKHMVAVFEDGVKYVIWMEDYKLAEAVNHTNINSKFNETIVGSTMSAMTRWLSVNFTGKNPAFIPINWVCDIKYATLSHLMRHDGQTAKMYANMGKASVAIHRFNTGSANPLSDEELAGYSMHNPKHLLHLFDVYDKKRVMDTLFKMYRINGGETGYIHTDDIRTWAKRLRRHLQREMGTNSTVDKLKQAGSKYTGLHAAGRLLDYAAYQSENMTRFATFLAAWESGKGFAEAASDAKNITVNFNRKGRISSILNSIMVFFNATVQGTDNLIDRVIVPNKGRFATAASILFAASILASSMAIAAYGDGDDSPYWRMPEFVRYNSLLVPTYGIGGDEKFLIIPLPHGLRFINGWAAASLEGYYGKKRASEVASAMASSLFDNTSPVGVNGGDLTRTFIPSIAVPFYDIAINKDYAGRPVYREMFTQELRDNTPNSQQGSRDVNEAFAGFAQWLNELGGGDENLPAGVDRSTGKVNKLKRALLDINPSKIEHVLSYYAGGRGQFFLDCYRTARPTWDSNAELETRNIPVVRRLWGGATAASDAKAFYDRVDNLKRYQYYIDKSFKEGDRKGINESLVNLDVYRWAAMSEAYSEQVRDLSRMADGKSITKDQRKELLERRKLLMRQFLNSTNNYDKITEKLANNE